MQFGGQEDQGILKHRGTEDTEIFLFRRRLNSVFFVPCKLRWFHLGRDFGK